jgi:4a-hydroxytetrahydrobiopterin dehydratase
MSSNEDMQRAIAELANWRELKDGKIVKYFQFPSFMKAMGFVNSIPKIADAVNHHPVITISWRTVKLSLKSLDVDAITSGIATLQKK